MNQDILALCEANTEEAFRSSQEVFNFLGIVSDNRQSVKNADESKKTLAFLDMRAQNASQDSDEIELETEIEVIEFK